MTHPRHRLSPNERACERRHPFAATIVAPRTDTHGRDVADARVGALGVERVLCYTVYTMSNRVGIRELRLQASALLRRVAAGEVIEITDHGHPIARIVPLRPSVLDQLVLENRASEADGDLLELMDELELPAAAERGRTRPTRALDELRANER
jgi:prevent-host-death family protein